MLPKIADNCMRFDNKLYYLIKLEERKRNMGFIVFPKMTFIRYKRTSETVFWFVLPLKFGIL